MPLSGVLSGKVAIVTGARRGIGRAAATDWSKFGITVNVIYPVIATAPLQAWIDESPENRKTIESHVPTGYLGDAAQDLAPIVVFIASDAARYLTGHPFFIDGGPSNAPR